MPDRFRDHRRALADEIGDDALAIVPAASETPRNADVHHPFRQDSNFYYLTGLEEPDAVAVIAPGHPDGEFLLFVHPKDREAEIWNGVRVGPEGAKTRFQADDAFELDRLDQVLTRLMVGREVLYYRLGDARHDARVLKLLDTARRHHARFGRPVPDVVRDVDAVLAELRLRKSPPELESLRAAAELSAEGHREAMRFTRPGLYEYQVQAAMEYLWREGGSPRNGYPAIVAAGANAVILHYTDNDAQIEEDDLLLIDAAAEVDHYTADITRTFPASGTFTAPQLALYEVVLAAQRAAIAEIRPGSTFEKANAAAVRVLTEGLVELGLLPRGVEDSLQMHHYREFFMHGIGHWLGLDVHDVGSYRVGGTWRPLEPGMVLTIEPGLYVDPGRPEVTFALQAYDLDAVTERRILDPDARRREREEWKEAEKITHRIPPDFLGIGVRIEDDLVVTEDGHEILSGLVPVDPPAVEALCREASWLTRS